MIIIIFHSLDDWFGTQPAILMCRGIPRPGSSVSLSQDCLPELTDVRIELVVYIARRS